MQGIEGCWAQLWLTDQSVRPFNNLSEFLFITDMIPRKRTKDIQKKHDKIISGFYQCGDDRASSNMIASYFAHSFTVCFKVQFRVSDCYEIFLRTNTFHYLTLRQCDLLCMRTSVLDMVN